ncbi:MAG: hypothetical protein H7240_07475 [Glaciimonas sp.]|nr:hypothetical protein [Glaciimonas sp.]
MSVKKISNATGFEPVTKKIGKREFLEQMEKVVPWTALIERIPPFYPWRHGQLVVLREKLLIKR